MKRFCFAIGATLAISMWSVSPAALASHDPQVTGCTGETEVCKPSCNNDTEITTSLCIGQKPGDWVCCSPSTGLAPGSGGCPTYGDQCHENVTACPTGMTKTSETCLAGNGICCHVAATTTPVLVPSFALTDPLGGIGILGALNRVISTLLGFIGGVALLVFVYSGVVYMTAGGNADRVKAAVDTMKYAIIGLALIVFSYAIVNFYFQSITAVSQK